MKKSNNIFRDLNARVVFCCLFSSLGAVCFALDTAWWGLILGATYFNEEFGSGEAGAKSLTTNEQSIGTTMGTLGIIIGCMIAPFINDKYGRKVCFVVLSIVGLIGMIIQATCAINKSYWQLVGGKIVLSISAGIAASVVGSYLSEVSPASGRGAMLSFYSIIQNLGYVVGGVAVYFVIFRMDKWNYLTPVLLQGLAPVLILAGIAFIPESPRWLVSQGKLEEATRAMRSLRNGDDASVALEIEEIRDDFERQRRLHAGVSWFELFKGANRRRTLIAIGLQSLQQAQGISFLSNYLVLLFIQIGISNVYQILVILYAVLFFSSLAGLYLPDKFGRRVLLLTGSTVMTICMATVGAVTTAQPSPKGALANLMIAAIFIWVVIFCVSWSPMPWTISSEVSSNPLREKTLALAAWSGFVVGLIVGLITPYIQNAQYGNLGGKIGYIWMCFSFISGVWVYFWVPELKGRSLEELDLMFEAKIPTREFGKYDITQLLSAQYSTSPSAAIPYLESEKDDKMDISHVEDKIGA